MIQIEREKLDKVLEALERSVATCFNQYAHQQVMSQPDHFINTAITAIKEALANVATNDTSKERVDEMQKQRHEANVQKFLGAPQPEPVTIWYMRDNHTFKKLSADVSIALIEIEQEFNEGHTYGMLCSKRKGFPNVHASGEKKRLEFFAECKKTLEEWLPNTTPTQRTWVGLTDDDDLDWEEGGNLKDLVKAIEAKLKQKNGYAEEKNT